MCAQSMPFQRSGYLQVLSPATNQVRPSHLEIVPNIPQAALHKGFSGFFLQWRSSHIQSMDIRQVIDAANIHPIPGANLLKKEKKTP